MKIQSTYYISDGGGGERGAGEVEGNKIEDPSLNYESKSVIKYNDSHCIESVQETD